MSRVEAFVTRIKIEPSDQSPFWELIKGSRSPPNCKNQRIKNAWLQFDLLVVKKKFNQSRGFEGTIKQSSTLFGDQQSWSHSQMLQQATYKWPPSPHLILCTGNYKQQISLPVWDLNTYWIWAHLFGRSSPRRPRGSSNQSDDQTDKGPSRTPRKGQGKKPTSPPSYEEEREVAKPSFNFFDFREGSDDIFVESPDSLVKKMRQQAKDRRMRWLVNSPLKPSLNTHTQN